MVPTFYDVGNNERLEDEVGTWLAGWGVPAALLGLLCRRVCKRVLPTVERCRAAARLAAWKAGMRHA